MGRAIQRGYRHRRFQPFDKTSVAPGASSAMLSPPVPNFGKHTRGQAGTPALQHHLSFPFQQRNQIADDGAGGRQASGAFAVEDLRYGVECFDFERVEFIAGVREQMRKRNTLRANSRLDFSARRRFAKPKQSA